MSIELTVYSRNGCHLCEDMEAQLESLSAELAFSLHRVDIDTKPELVERFGSRVPVLMKQDRFVCEYFLDQSALLQVLNSTDEQ